MHIEQIYDRTDLINVTTHTVLHNMVVGIVLIFLVQWMFLGNLRSALIVAATIPFALLFADRILVLRGESANLLSVGAIDFGLIVDATVIMVENIFRHLSRRPADERICARRWASRRRRRAHAASSRTIASAGDRGEPGDLLLRRDHHRGLRAAVHAVAASKATSSARWRKTYAYAIVGGLLATFTVSPALSAAAAAGQDRGDRDVRRARPAPRLPAGARLRAGQPHADARAALASLLVLALARGALVSASSSCRKLEEGNLWIRATMPPSISLEEGNGYVNRMRHIIKQLPGGRDRDFAARPAGRRHRRDRLLQRRVLRAAEAIRHMAAGVDKETADRADEPSAGSRVSRRRLQLLAIYRGQCRRGRVRRERARTRSSCSATISQRWKRPPTRSRT